MIKKALIISLIILAFALPCHAQGVVVFGSTDPPINLLTNPDFGTWSNSTLAQGTTGVQSDFEYGSPEHYDDCEDDGIGDYILSDCTLDPNIDAGNGAGGSDGYYVVKATNPTQYVKFICSGLVVGHYYKTSLYLKNGTHTLYHQEYFAATNNATSNYYNRTYLASCVAWADFSIIWRATETNNCIMFHLAMNPNETIFMDEYRIIEVTPGCVAADALACDGWGKDTTLDVLREPNGTNVKGYYGLRSHPSAQNDFFVWPSASVYSTTYHTEQYQGRQVVCGAWALSSTASDFCISIYDGASTYSQYHSGGGTLEWLEVTDMISASATTVYVQFIHRNASPGDAYISEPVLTYGTSINPGQYYPTNKIVLLENDISSYKFDGSATVSDGSGTLYLGGDTSAKLPYGARAVKVQTVIKDTGSAADCYFKAGWDLSECAYDFINSPYGRAANQDHRVIEWIPLNANGNFEYTIEQATVMTITDFEYIAVEVR